MELAAFVPLLLPWAAAVVLAGARAAGCVLGLPHTMARSTWASSGGSPRSANTLPESIRSVSRPMCRNGSRVTEVAM